MIVIIYRLFFLGEALWKCDCFFVLWCLLLYNLTTSLTDLDMGGLRLWFCQSQASVCNWRECTQVICIRLCQWQLFEACPWPHRWRADGNVQVDDKAIRRVGVPRRTSLSLGPPIIWWVDDLSLPAILFRLILYIISCVHLKHPYLSCIQVSWFT